jgi:Fur family ferric uptake transcriptional regulator
MTSHSTVPPARRRARVRATRHAAALCQVLADLPEFRSAQDIHAELRRRGTRIRLTTVDGYLKVLSEDGMVDTLRGKDGETLYRRYETSTRHHHVTCRSCGRSAEVEGQAIEHWAEGVAPQAGFIDVDHTLEIFGLCSDCAGERP